MPRCVAPGLSEPQGLPRSMSCEHLSLRDGGNKGSGLCAPVECLLYAVELGVPGASGGAGPDSSHAPPSSHTSTVRNNLCSLLLRTSYSQSPHIHASVPLHTLFFLPVRLFSPGSPPPCRHNSRASSSMKCVTPRTSDPSLGATAHLAPTSTRCVPYWTVLLHCYMK